MSDVMRLNTLSPGEGSRSSAKRVGRGIGSGLGKTAGRLTKARRHAPVAVFVRVSKVVRCPCRSACQNTASSRVWA